MEVDVFASLNPSSRIFIPRETQENNTTTANNNIIGEFFPQTVHYLFYLFADWFKQLRKLTKKKNLFKILQFSFGFKYLTLVEKLNKMFVIQLLKSLIPKNKRGGPILEEILLIGIAVLIFVIITGLIFGLIDWANFNIEDIFGKK